MANLHYPTIRLQEYCVEGGTICRQNARRPPRRHLWVPVPHLELHPPLPKGRAFTRSGPRSPIIRARPSRACLSRCSTLPAGANCSNSSTRLLVTWQSNRAGTYFPRHLAPVWRTKVALFRTQFKRQRLIRKRIEKLIFLHLETCILYADHP